MRNAYAAPVEDEEAEEPESVPVGWQAAVAASDWGERVVAALRARMRDSERLLEPAALVDAWSERDPDGVRVLRAIYDHPYWPQRTGLRLRLDEPPFDWPNPAHSDGCTTYWSRTNTASTGGETDTRTSPSTPTSGAT